VICKNLADLSDFNSPQAPASLLKTAVLCCGIVVLEPGALPLDEQLRAAGGGLRITTWSYLPQGSGLGTSSILAAGVIKAILVALGRDVDNDSLVHMVLKLEQMLTTGGGWQDQVGGIFGGAKIARSAAVLPLRVVTEPIPIDSRVVAELNKRLVLVFTGRPRLAKYLLQNVLRQWFSRLPEICATVDGLASNAEMAADAMRVGDLTRVGECLTKYWEQKRCMAPGCEPSGVALLRKRFADKLLGSSLCGAGGGGFAVLITAEPNMTDAIARALTEIPGLEDASAHTCEIDLGGLCVLGGKTNV
jgi:fucokinase